MHNNNADALGGAGVRQKGNVAVVSGPAGIRRGREEAGMEGAVTVCQKRMCCFVSGLGIYMKYLLKTTQKLMSLL